MSTSRMKDVKQRKAIAFVLIVVLMVGGLITPIVSMAGNDTNIDVFKVTYKLSDNKSDDIEVDVPIGEDGKAALTKELIPDDPKVSEGTNFAGWKNLNAKTKEEEDKIWSKNDLEDFPLEEDVDFQAVFEEVGVDGKIDAIEEDDQNEQDNQNVTKDAVSEDTSKKDKGVALQDAGDLNMSVVYEVGSKTVTATSDSGVQTISPMAFNGSGVITITIDNIGHSKNVKDNILKIELPEGLRYTSFKGKTDDPNVDDFGTDSQYIDFRVKPTGDYGELSYNIKDDCSRIKIILTVAPDVDKFYGPHVMKENTIITLSNTDNGQPKNEKVEFKTGITGEFNFSATGEQKSIYTPYDVPFWTGLVSPSINKDGISNQVVDAKKWSFTLTYPSSAKLHDAYASIPTDGEPTKTFSNGISTTSGIEHDESSRTVTFYYDAGKPGYRPGNLYRFQLKLEFPSTGGAVTNTSIRLPSRLDVTAYDDTEQSWICSYANAQSPIYITDDPRELLTTNKKSDTHNAGYTAQRISGDPTSYIEGYSVLGRFIFANASGQEIKDQVVEYNFPEELNVRGMDFPSALENTSEVTVNFIKKDKSGTITSDSTKVKNTNNAEKVRVKPSDFKLQDGEIIISASAMVGDFPIGYAQGDSSAGGSVLFGNIYDEASGSYDITCTMRNSGNETNTSTIKVTAVDSKVGPIMTGVASSSSTDNKTYSHNAGTTATIKGTLNGYSGVFSGIIQRTHDPIIYMRLVNGMTVDTNDVVVTQGSNNVKDDAKVETINGEQVLVIKTKNCIIGWTKEDLTVNNDVQFSFGLKLNKNMRTKTYDMDSLLFAGPSQSNFNTKRYAGFVMGSSTATCFIKKDTSDLNQNNDTDENLVTVHNDSKLLVTQNESVNIGAKIKRSDEEDSDYRTYSDADANSIVKFIPGSKADYKLTIENNANSSTSAFTTYIPVPKEGKNFGSMFQTSKYAFSMKLSELVKIDPDYEDAFDISYCVIDQITATSRGGVMNELNALPFTKTPADLSKVNMIKIELKNTSEIGIGKSVNIMLLYDIDIPSSDAAKYTGKTNIFNPFYEADFGSSAGYMDGDAVAASVQQGIIKGFVFEDIENKNGVFNAGEKKFTSEAIKVKLIKTPVGYTGTTVTSIDGNGEYEFTGLANGEYDVQFDLPNGYVFTNKGPGPSNTYRESSVVDSTGKYVGVDPTDLSKSMYINAGYAKNQAPVITVKNVEMTTEGTFAPKYETVTDDIDTSPTSVKVTSESAVPSPLVPGTYAVTYSAVDQFGLTGTAVQKVKVHGLPHVVTSPAMYRSILSAPAIAELSGNVKIEYMQASDSIGDSPTKKTLAATITAPQPAPTTPGKHEITFISPEAENGIIKSGKASGKFDLNLISAPIVKATSGGKDYTTGAKTNQDVTITMQAINNLTSQYSTNGGLNWINYTDPITSTTDDYKVSTYMFRYKETEKLDANLRVPLYTTFATNINKTKPLLWKQDNEFIVSDGAVYNDPFNAKAVPRVTNDALDIKATKNGIGFNFTDGMKLGGGAYEFSITDGYGNVTILNFSFKALVVTATDVAVDYDGSLHGIMAAADKAGYKLWYSTTEAGQYTDTAIKYSNVKRGAGDSVDSYTIWVKATHNDYPGSSPVSVKLTISPRAITVKPVDVTTTYTGIGIKANDVELTVGSNKLVAGDRFDISNAIFSGIITDAGISNSAVSGVKIAKTNNSTDATGNYDISYEKGNLQIHASDQLAVTAVPVSTIYDGNAHGITQVDSNVNGAKIYYSTDSGATWSQNSPKFVNAGKNDVLVIAEKMPNYVTSAAFPSSVEIKQRPISITANSDSKTYDGKVLEPTKYTIGEQGLAGNEKLDVTYSGSITDKGTVASNIASYIFKNGQENTTNNYAVTTKTGTLEIKARPITITPNSDSKIYDGKAIKSSSRTIGGQGLVKGEDLSVTYSGSQTNYGSSTSKISSYKITAGNTDKTHNYDATLKTGTMKVDARPVTIVPNDEAKTFDGTPLRATSVKVSSNSKYNMLSGDKLTNPTFNTSISNVGTTKVKVLSVKVNGKANNNYTFTSENGTLTVNPAPVVEGQTSSPGGGQPTGTNATYEPDGGVLGTDIEPTTENTTPIAPKNASIGEGRVPLTTQDGNGWALINLLLTIAGLVIAAMISVMAIYRKFKDSEVEYIEDENKFYEKEKKSRLLLIIGAILLSISGLVLFLLTEDMSQMMVLFDSLTIVNAMIFVAEMIAATFAFRTKKSEIDTSEFRY